jgi:perosamine synthetase
MSSTMAAEPYIPLCVPEFRGSEWRYVKECLDTAWVSSVGEYVDRFEMAVSTRVGARHGIATVNGTAALHIALLVAGVHPGDEVLVSTLTFIAPANAIRYAGAWPVFIDAEPRHWQMDAEKLVDFIEHRCRWQGGGLYNQATGRRVRAILPVHILGHPVDLDRILITARKYGLAVVEDATESLGAEYKGGHVGHLGDIACFSFNGNKLITTGGGGMIVTDNEEWARRAKHLTTQAKKDSVEYIHDEVGYNYRLTNLQAALGVAQMEQLESYIEAKCGIAAFYNDAFHDLDGVVPMRQASWALSTYWMYTVLIDEAASEMGSRELLRNLARHNIQTRPLWQPLHCSTPYRGAYATDCSVAERLYRDALSLPCSVGLTPDEQERVIDRVSLSLSASREVVPL